MFVVFCTWQPNIKCHPEINEDQISTEINASLDVLGDPFLLNSQGTFKLTEESNKSTRTYTCIQQKHTPIYADIHKHLHPFSIIIGPIHEKNYEIGGRKERREKRERREERERREKREKRRERTQRRER